MKIKMVSQIFFLILFVILIYFFTSFTTTLRQVILISQNLAQKSIIVKLTSANVVVNVDDFGAKGDGTTDDSEAFKKAWNKVCSSEGGVLVVPRDKLYYLKPTKFKGPCKSNPKMKIFGKIKASNNISDYNKYRPNWLVFKNIQDFVVEGSGTIDGNGRIWWQNSCKINKTRSCHSAPTAVTFLYCTNLRVENLRIKNAQQMHLRFEKCTNVKASNLNVIAPETSPNTDGIHVTGTKNIKIKTSVIGTGDDCVSIVSGSRNVEIKDITCGPGHGISIGSLGKNKADHHVADIIVDGAKLLGTTNGVRIKSWQGGSGYAKNIKFQNITMQNVFNPLIIDQIYCDRKFPCSEQRSAVQIENVVYKNIKGTSASKKAIKFGCSKAFPCQGILLQDINLRRHDGDGDTVAASFENVMLQTRGRVSPH